MKFVSLSFLWWVVLIRSILPIIWCLNYIFSVDSLNKQYDTVLLLLLVLIFQLIVFLFLIRYIVNCISYQIRRNSLDQIRLKTKTFGDFFLILLILLLLLNYDSLPIFMDLGSDSIVALNETNKIKTWLSYGLMSTIVVILLVAATYEKDTKKIVYRLFAFLASIITGKKSALLAFFMKYLLIQYIFSKNKKTNVLILFLAMLMSLVFGLVQFINTGIVQEDIGWIDLTLSILYSHGTSYLGQFISLNGVDFALSYSESISGGSLAYFFNPFVKFITGSGIDRAIGPYLSYHLFGNTFPNGVNPTLFFELIFVFGDTLYGFFVIPIMIIWLYIQKLIFRKIITTHVFLLKTGFLLLLFFFFGFLFDSLNAIRSLPFALIPFIMHLLSKILTFAARKNTHDIN